MTRLLQAFGDISAGVQQSLRRISGQLARLKARNNARWHLRVLGRRLEHRRNFIPVSNSDQKLLLGLRD